MISRPQASRMAGFTLLEVMLALAIFATLAAAVLSAGQHVVKQTADVERRLFAAWLADNRLSELRLQAGSPMGQQQHVVHMDRRDWLVRQRVTGADAPGFFKAEIDVSLGDGEQWVHRTSGWIPVLDE